MKRGNRESTTIVTYLVDTVSIIISFYLAAIIRGGILTMEGGLPRRYGNILILLVLLNILFKSNGEDPHKTFKRGYFEEFIFIARGQGRLILGIMAYLFLLKMGSIYSRLFFAIFFIINFLMNYVLRSYMKVILLLWYKKSASSRKVMLITSSTYVDDMVRELRSEYEWNAIVDAITLWDESRIGSSVQGIRVTADRETIFDEVRMNVVDDVLIYLPRQKRNEIELLILEMEKMGIRIHIKIDNIYQVDINKKVIEEFVGQPVITFSTALFDTKQMILKRVFDILGGVVGSIFTLILTLILAPIIWIESPGPIWFSQVRIGKNGRRFKIYKFRSMYKDAEARKQELMAKNEMDGHMFKITDDPRITKVGKFIRKTSLDEFPQFFNVLKGDMSLVGTRPPTEDEFLQYDSHHKRRLMLKPGITGLWQVSGRSDITNFEEVVQLDLEYINNWSIKLDIKLVLKTVVVVLMGRGSK